MYSVGMHHRRTLLLTLSTLLFLGIRVFYSHHHSSPIGDVVPLIHLNSLISSTIPPRAGQWYRVDRVIDGDTVVLAIEGVKTTIRLVGLDTPEVVDPYKPVQCFGPEASQEAHLLLDSQTVRFEGDSSQGIYDKYHRTLGYIFLTDGTNFAQTMIEKGYGREYTYKTVYPYQKAFKAAQVSAQEANVGLWRTCK